jgi:hypothetical protein
MKTVRPVVLFVFGILAALLALGCSNPIAASPGEAAAAGSGTEPESYTDLDSPFTVTFTIRQDGTARSVASLGSQQLGSGGIRNFVQLVAVDQTTKEIAGLAEARQNSSTNTHFALTLEGLTKGKTYAFLLLMGYWEHTNYTYTAGPPTLLCAGLTPNQGLNSTGNTTVTITMYPLVVDTKFERTTDGLIIEPKIVDGKPEPAYITPGTWKTIWTVPRLEGGVQNGFENPLVKAQKIINSSWGDVLKIKSRKFFSSSLNAIEDSATSTPHFFNYNIAGTMVKGSSGWTTFNLEYVPFNLLAAGDSNPWTPYNAKSKFILTGTNTPVWIIRNGVNDSAQTVNTDFVNFSNNNPSFNGNGGVRFEVGLPPFPPPPPIDPTPLTVDDGKFSGDPYRLSPVIEFTTGGYTSGTAEVWYAKVPAETSAPSNADYDWLQGSVGPGGPHQKTIAVPSSLWSPSGKEYDVYVVIYKDGKVSAPEIISSSDAGTIIVVSKMLVSNGVKLTDYIPKPVVGASPEANAFTDEQYISSAVTWSGALSGGQFTSGVAYTATVTLTATTGFSFEGAGPNEFACHDATIGVTILGNGDSATLTITFPAL